MTRSLDRTGVYPPRLARLQPQPPDTLLALIGLHGIDPRTDKLDLGVGVYRDAAGDTPVMRSIRAAEKQLAETQASKAYLGPEGDPEFVAALATIVLGRSLAESPRIRGVQTPGGTGALRLGAELIAAASPDAQVWIGTPTWPNHAPIFRRAGLAVRTHPFAEKPAAGIDFARMMSALENAAPGDVILLHGCCHNPTGCDFDADQWAALAAFTAHRGLIPFVDLAYQGLGNGLEADAAGMRLLFERVPEALLAYSCDKNFALYRERVGALWVQTQGAATAAPVFGNILTLARSLWSMPPDHGGRAVGQVLDDPALCADWLLELSEMRHRLNSLRGALAAADPRLAAIGHQRGLFAMLPVSAATVALLRKDHGIYMADSGRINIAGLAEGRIADFTRALAPHLPR